MPAESDDATADQQAARRDASADPKDLESLQETSRSAREEMSVVLLLLILDS